MQDESMVVQDSPVLGRGNDDDDETQEEWIRAIGPVLSASPKRRPRTSTCLSVPTTTPRTLTHTQGGDWDATTLSESILCVVRALVTHCPQSLQVFLKQTVIEGRQVGAYSSLCLPQQYISHKTPI